MKKGILSLLPKFVERRAHWIILSRTLGGLVTPLTRVLNSMLTALTSLSLSLSRFESLLNLICGWKKFLTS